MLCWPLHLSSFRLSCADVWSKGRLEDDTFPTSQQKIEKILYSYNLLTYNMLNVTSKHRLTLLFTLQHRRRIKTEEKAKGADSVWGEEFIQFLAALAISSWLWRKGLIHPFLLTNPGAIHPIIQIVQCKTASAARNWIKLFPPNRSDDLCLFFVFFLLLCSTEASCIQDISYQHESWFADLLYRDITTVYILCTVYSLGKSFDWCRLSHNTPCYDSRGVRKCRLAIKYSRNRRINSVVMKFFLCLAYNWDLL